SALAAFGVPPAIRPGMAHLVLLDQTAAGARALRLWRLHVILRRVEAEARAGDERALRRLPGLSEGYRNEYKAAGLMPWRDVYALHGLSAGNRPGRSPYDEAVREALFHYWRTGEWREVPAEHRRREQRRLKRQGVARGTAVLGSVPDVLGNQATLNG